jgi:predicted transcriptional regulator
LDLPGERDTAETAYRIFDPTHRRGTGQPPWHGSAVSTDKTMSIRLSVELADALVTVAAVDKTPMSEIIRNAIDAYIAARTQDAEFRQRLHDHIQQARNLLDEDTSKR